MSKTHSILIIVLVALVVFIGSYYIKHGSENTAADPEVLAAVFSPYAIGPFSSGTIMVDLSFKD